MTAANITRILAGLSFLIFFCPFFDMCSGHEAATADASLETPVEITETPQETVTETAPQPETVINNEIESVLNGYRVAAVFAGSIIENRLDLHEKDTWQDPVVYTVLFFVIATLISLSIFILNLLKKYRTVFILSCVNIFFIVAETITFFLPEGVFEEPEQIKFGYYLFVANGIALIFVGYKAKNQPTHAV
jgi:hypothetical protein